MLKKLEFSRIPENKKTTFYLIKTAFYIFKPLKKYLETPEISTV